MGKVVPLNKKKIIKKREKSFERHQHQQFWRIGRSSWRKSKGIIIINIYHHDKFIYTTTTVNSINIITAINIIYCSIENVICIY